MQRKITKPEAKQFNSNWDAKVDLDYKKIESHNHDLDESLYPYLGPDALYTSFADYHQLLSELPDSVKHVCDLGAGVGRIAPIWKELRAHGEVSLIELVESRMNSAKEISHKLNLSGIHFYQQDLLLERIPVADAYFIYLPVSKVLEKIICDLRILNRECYVMSIESHGNLFDRFSEFKELKLEKSVELFSERHNPFGRIYRFVPDNSEMSLIDSALASSFKNRVITMSEKSGKWLGLTEDLTWSNSSELLLKYPPRTISSDSIHSVGEFSNFSEDICSALHMMKNSTPFKGSVIRKIWIGPELKLELLSGAMVPFQKSDFI